MMELQKTSISSLMNLTSQEMGQKLSFYNCVRMSGKGEDP